MIFPSHVYIRHYGSFLLELQDDSRVLLRSIGADHRAWFKKSSFAPLQTKANVLAVELTEAAYRSLTIEQWLLLNDHAITQPILKTMTNQTFNIRKGGTLMATVRFTSRTGVISTAKRLESWLNWLWKCPEVITAHPVIVDDGTQPIRPLDLRRMK